MERNADPSKLFSRTYLPHENLPRKFEPSAQFPHLFQGKIPLSTQEHRNRTLRTKLRNQVTLREILLFNKKPHHGSRSQLDITSASLCMTPGAPCAIVSAGSARTVLIFPSQTLQAKQKERSLEPLPLTIFTARNMPFGRDDPGSLNRDFRLFEPVRQCRPVRLLSLWGYALPPPYSTQLLVSIERTITKERLSRYLGATRQDVSKALALYEYNVELS